MFKIFISSVLLLLLTACSSKTIDPMEFAGQFKDKFSTEIKGDGIKLFVYSAKLATAADRNINDQSTNQMPSHQILDYRKDAVRRG